MSCHSLFASARRACLLVLSIACGTYSAPLAAAPGYVFRDWEAGDGLPQNAVTAVVQTRDGYIWVGTYSGLARFDGVRFTSFYDGNTPGMRSSRVTTLLETEDGSLWIGHEGGEVTRYQDGKFQAVALRTNWGAREVFSIGEDDTGDLWLVNTEGLVSRLKDGLALAPRLGSTRGMVNVARGERAFWVARNGFVSTVQRGELAQLELDGKNETYIQGICASRDGRLWVVSEGQVRKWDGAKWSESRSAPDWSTASISAMIETRAGCLVVGTPYRGLFLLFPNGESLHFNHTNGLPSGWVRSLCEDREGNLWVGTGSGLVMLRASSVEIVTPPDQWESRPILSVSSGRDGALWVGTEGAGLYQLKQGQWSQFGSAAGLSNQYVWAAAEDAQGRVWAGTWGSGVFVQNGARLESAPGLDLKMPTLALLHSGASELWIGTSKGPARYEAGKLTWVGAAGQLSLPDVRAVAKDREGTVWFGMLGGGLGRFKEGVIRQFRKADGLSSDFVQCLRADREGTLWIGTFGGGLTRLKDGRFSAITMNHGLADNFICWIEDDERGNFWLSSHAGIMRVNKAELDSCADGKLRSVSCLVLGTGDGLPTPECSGGLQPAGCKTPDGRLWFPTTKGLVVVDPQRLTTNSLAPPVVIEAMRVDGKYQILEARGQHQGGSDFGHVNIAPGRHRLEFDFTGLSFVAPEKVRFQCRLEGLEEEWADVGTKRSANFNFVPPGDYTFRVIACNNDGVWNEAGASLAFTLLPRFWQTMWFRGLSGVLAAVVGGGIVWLDARGRTRRKVERIERQHAVEHERARIAQDIHDDLGATLTRITMLSDPVRGKLDGPERVAASLNRIHDSARELTRAMDEIVWAVNPKHDTLDSLMSYLERFAQEFLESAGIRCRLDDVPFQLPAWPLTAEVRHNLFLAFKEALHNVLKHAAASEVQISLRLGAKAFTLTLLDDGCGFSLGEAETSVPPGASRVAPGNGIRNMRQRLADIGGHCEIQSSPGKGTKVNLFVPANPHPPQS